MIARFVPFFPLNVCLGVRWLGLRYLPLKRELELALPEA